jgi:hypothetical protein
MKIEWANNGEAYEINVDGEPKMVFSATIDLEDGEAVQKFEGESHKEITDKLLIAQANATARIRELRKPAQTPATPPKAPLQFSKKPLTADERFTMAQDLSDPEKAPEAIRRAVEAELGAPLETVREKLQSDQDRDLQDQDQRTRLRSSEVRRRTFYRRSTTRTSSSNTASCITIRRMMLRPTTRFGKP